MNQSLPAVAAWLTHADQSILLQKQGESLHFTDIADEDPYPWIQIDAAITYQTIEGFGFALTGGSAYLLNHLSAATKHSLLKEIFSNGNDGIGVSYLRVSIGASDLSATSFSYDDVPANQTDPELIHFNLTAGDCDLVPVLREIIAINPNIKIIATPWSAPPWMKTSGGFIGGKLSPKYYQAYANYFVKYLRAMKDNGIFIHAITPQNEPMNHENEPSMVMEAIEQADFIKNYLGPTLHDAGLRDIEIFCWDHNCDLKEYPLTVLSDPETRKYVTGIAWHLYGGDVSAIFDVHQVYPEMKMAFTEQWVGLNGKFADDLAWHIKNVMVGTIRSWSKIVLEWNLASDLSCGPHTPKGASSCVGALTIDVNHEQIVRNVSYYVIAHAAKFVSPGSLRIFSTQVDSLPNVAFKTPSGEIVLLVLNENQQRQSFTIKFGRKLINATLEGGSVGTYTW
ncbi:glucosylceramidase [Gammaproteobacteria bacterium]